MPVSGIKVSTMETNQAAVQQAENHTRLQNAPSYSFALQGTHFQRGGQKSTLGVFLYHSLS